MSTLDSTLDSAGGEATGAAAADAGATAITLAGVLTTSDHKVIGRLLVAGSLLGLLAVAAIGAMLGLERVDGDDTLFDTDVQRQLFSVFRVGLVDIAVVPLLLGLAVFVVPLQLGARALAFPRAAAAGLWAWLCGVVLLIVAFANNGGPAGSNADFVELYLAANVLTMIGLTAIAATVATSVLTTRAPGMRLHRAPLFSWAALAGSLGLVLALPVAAGTHIYLFVDHRYTGGEFGGAAGIWGWTSFLYSGPALGLYAVLGLGVVAELIPVTFRRRLPHRFVAFVGLGLAATAAFAAVAQQDVVTLPGTGTPVKLSNFMTKFGFLANWAILTLLPVLGVVIVLGLGAYVGKPTKGTTLRPRITAAFVFGFFGLGLVLAGMLAAAVLGIEDLSLTGTVFEEGAATAVLYGAVFAGLGAVAYWFPKLGGHKLPEPALVGLALLGALGAALASAPYLVAGFTDQPGFAGVYDNDGPGGLWNGAVAIGHALVVLVLLAFAGLAARSWRSAGAVAGDDPWEAHTLEWSTTSPPAADNFATTPTVMSPEPLLDLRAKPDFAVAAEAAEAAEAAR
jgi:heme/copper-type cytochrome/quinol oxidase subunit 1